MFTDLEVKLIPLFVDGLKSGPTVDINKQRILLLTVEVWKKIENLFNANLLIF